MGAINLKLILLGASVFFAGVFIRGEFANRQELRRELRDLKDAQTQIKQEVASINAAYAAQKLDLARRTDTLYSQIDQIIRLKTINGQQIRNLQNNIASQRQQLYLEIHDLQQVISQHPVGVKKNDQ